MDLVTNLVMIVFVSLAIMPIFFLCRFFSSMSKDRSSTYLLETVDVKKLTSTLSTLYTSTYSWANRHSTAVDCATTKSPSRVGGVAERGVAIVGYGEVTFLVDESTTLRNLFPPTTPPPTNWHPSCAAATRKFNGSKGLFVVGWNDNSNEARHRSRLELADASNNTNFIAKLRNVLDGSGQKRESHLSLPRVACYSYKYHEDECAVDNLFDFVVPFEQTASNCSIVSSVSLIQGYDDDDDAISGPLIVSTALANGPVHVHAVCMESGKVFSHDTAHRLENADDFSVITSIAATQNKDKSFILAVGGVIVDSENSAIRLFRVQPELSVAGNGGGKRLVVKQTTIATVRTQSSSPLSSIRFSSDGNVMAVIIPASPLELFRLVSDLDSGGFSVEAIVHEVAAAEPLTNVTSCGFFEGTDFIATLSSNSAVSIIQLAANCYTYSLKYSSHCDGCVAIQHCGFGSSGLKEITMLALSGEGVKLTEMSKVEQITSLLQSNEIDAAVEILDDVDDATKNLVHNHVFESCCSDRSLTVTIIRDHLARISEPDFVLGIALGRTHNKIVTTFGVANAIIKTALAKANGVDDDDAHVLSKFEAKLQTFELIRTAADSAVHESPFEYRRFVRFARTPVIKFMKSCAMQGRIEELKTLMTRHPIEDAQTYSDLMLQLPPTLDPSDYKSLLLPSNLSPENQPASNLSPSPISKLKIPEAELIDCYRSMVTRIDKETNLVHLCCELLEILVLEKNFEPLADLHSHARLLLILSTNEKLKDNFMALSPFAALLKTDASSIIEQILYNGNADEFESTLSSFVLPNFRTNPSLPRSLVKYATTTAKMTLGPTTFLAHMSRPTLPPDSRLVNDDMLLIDLVLSSIYNCDRVGNKLDLVWQLFETLPQRKPDDDEEMTNWQNKIDVLENLLIATDVTSNYLTPPLLSDYSKHSATMGMKIIDSMCEGLNESERDIMDLVGDMKILEERVYKGSFERGYIEQKIVPTLLQSHKFQILVDLITDLNGDNNVDTQTALPQVMDFARSRLACCDQEDTRQLNVAIDCLTSFVGVFDAEGEELVQSELKICRTARKAFKLGYQGTGSSIRSKFGCGTVNEVEIEILVARNERDRVGAGEATERLVEILKSEQEENVANHSAVIKYFCSTESTRIANYVSREVADYCLLRATEGSKEEDLAVAAFTAKNSTDSKFEVSPPSVVPEEHESAQEAAMDETAISTSDDRDLRKQQQHIHKGGDGGGFLVFKAANKIFRGAKKVSKIIKSHSNISASSSAVDATNQHDNDRDVKLDAIQKLNNGVKREEVGLYLAQYCISKATAVRFSLHDDVAEIASLLRICRACIYIGSDEDANTTRLIMEELNSKVLEAEGQIGNNALKSKVAVADEAIVARLVKMGFNEFGSRKAAISCNNVWEASMNFCIEHSEEDDFCVPIAAAGDDGKWRGEGRVDERSIELIRSLGLEILGGEKGVTEKKAEEEDKEDDEEEEEGGWDDDDFFGEGVWDDKTPVKSTSIVDKTMHAKIAVERMASPLANSLDANESYNNLEQMLNESMSDIEELKRMAKREGSARGRNGLDEQTKAEAATAVEEEKSSQEQLAREEMIKVEKADSQSVGDVDRERQRSLELKRQQEEEERIEQERIEHERIEQERIEQERIAREEAAEKAERQRLELKRQQEEEERIEQERIEQERIAREEAAVKAERQRLELKRQQEEEERIEQERIEQERIEQERIAREEAAEKAERQRLELKRQQEEEERIEHERIEQERIEQERITREEATEKAEKQRIELERHQEEQERVAREESGERLRLAAAEEERKRSVEQARAHERSRLEKEEADRLAEEAFFKQLELERQQAALQSHLSAEKTLETSVADEEVATVSLADFLGDVRPVPTTETTTAPLPAPAPVTTASGRLTLRKVTKLQPKAKPKVKKTLVLEKSAVKDDEEDWMDEW